MKIKVEIEVPEGKYCMLNSWEVMGRYPKLYSCKYLIYGPDCSCAIFGRQPAWFDERKINGFHKLPACLEAERA